VPDRGWNRQLAAGDIQPIRYSLAAVVARLLANKLPVVVLAAPMIRSASFRLTSAE